MVEPALADPDRERLNLDRLAEALNFVRARWRIEGRPDGMRIDGGLEELLRRDKDIEHLAMLYEQRPELARATPSAEVDDGSDLHL